MSWSKFLFWSTVLSLPTLFLIPRKKPAPAVLEDEPVVTDPDPPPTPKN